MTSRHLSVMTALLGGRLKKYGFLGPTLGDIDAICLGQGQKPAFKNLCPEDSDTSRPDVGASRLEVSQALSQCLCSHVEACPQGKLCFLTWRCIGALCMFLLTD